MEDLNGYRKVGKYEISNNCKEIYPGRYHVKFENGDARWMSGDKIYRLFKSEGLSDPAIDQYAEFVRQHDHPTLQEMKKRVENQLMIKIQTDKREKEYVEQQKIVNQYKASSRLDKLKMKNNIK